MRLFISTSGFESHAAQKSPVLQGLRLDGLLCSSQLYDIQGNMDICSLGAILQRCCSARLGILCSYGELGQHKSVLNLGEMRVDKNSYKVGGGTPVSYQVQ